MNFNDVFSEMVERWQQLHGRLTGIDQQEQNPAIRTGERMRTIMNWREATLPRVDEFLKVRVPEMQNKARQDAATALTRIRAGKPLLEPEKVKPEIDWSSVITPENSAPAPNRDVLAAIESMKAELLLQGRIQTAVMLHQLSSTDRLAELVTSYRTAADDPESFPAEAFRVDSSVLPPLLRARADGGDVRATFALQQLEEVEPALLRSAGLADLPSRDGRIRDLEQIKEAVQGLGRGGMERLDVLDGVMGPIGRLIDQQREAMQQVSA